MVYSTLLANYVDFITAKPKVLHIAGFVTPQGLNCIIIGVKKKVNMRPITEIVDNKMYFLG